MVGSGFIKQPLQQCPPCMDFPWRLWGRKWLKDKIWDSGFLTLSSPYLTACVLSHFSFVWLFVTLWSAAHQAPLSMGFSRQEYWGGSPWPPSGNLPDLGIKPASLRSPVLVDGFFTTSSTSEFPSSHYQHSYLKPLVALIIIFFF